MTGSRHIVPGDAARKAKDFNRGIPVGTDIHYLCRVGRVTNVDYERFTCEVDMMDGFGSYREVEIGFGSAGPRSFCGAMPEIGEWVALGMFRDTPGLPRPRIIASFGGGIKDNLNWDITQRRAQSLGLEDRRPKRRRWPKLYPGDALVMGSGGAYGKFTEDARILSGAGQEFQLRASDQHALLRTLNASRATGAGRYHSGPVIRNPLSPGKPGEGVTSHQGIPAFLYPDGRRVHYVTSGRANGLQSAKDASPYIEDRVVLRQFSDMAMDVFGEMDLAEIDFFVNDALLRNSRYMEAMRGTFVGDDQDSAEAALYGHVVRLMMFGDAFNAEGSPDPQYISASSINEEGALALADHYRFFYPGQIDGGSGVVFIRDIDKYGTLYEQIPASGPIQPLGEGISVIRATQGAVKEHFGKSVSHGNSPPKRLDAIAGVEEEDIESGISHFQTLDGGLRLKIKGPDSTGDAYVIEVQEGNAKFFVNGDMEFHVTGKMQEFVDGDIQRVYGGDVVERIEGSFKREIAGDEIRHTAGDRLAVVVGDDTLHVGGGRVVATVNGQNQTLGSHPQSPVAPPPSLPPAPPANGEAGGSDLPGADPNPGMGSGIPSPPTTPDSQEFYGGNASRNYGLNLNETFLGTVQRDYNGASVNENYLGPASRRYAVTLSEEVVGLFEKKVGILQIDALGVGKISAAGALTLTSAVAVIEAAPQVIRG